jgi:hypothetical protein
VNPIGRPPLIAAGATCPGRFPLEVISNAAEKSDAKTVFNRIAILLGDTSSRWNEKAFRTGSSGRFRLVLDELWDELQPGSVPD